MNTQFEKHNQTVRVDGIISPRKVTLGVQRMRLHRMTEEQRNAELDRLIELEEAAERQKREDRK